MPFILLAYILVGLTAILLYWHRSLWRVMLLGGILVIPALLIKPLLVNDFLAIMTGSPDIGTFLAWQVILSVLIGALTIGVYEKFFHGYFSPNEHPVRSKLKWLFSGVIVFFILRLGFDGSFGLSLLIGLLFNSVVLLWWERSLLWDAVFSSVGMGAIYTLVFRLTVAGLPGDLHNLWFSDKLIGVTLMGVPVEEMVAVFLFGALFGPVLIGFKDSRLGEGYAERHRPSVLKKRVGTGAVGLAAFMALVFANQVFSIPSVVAVSPDQRTDQHSLVSPISLHFNRPIRRDAMTLTITPPIDGSVAFEEPVWGNHLYKKVLFIPDAPLSPEKRYTLTAKSAANIFGRSGQSQTYTITTQSLPTVLRTEPKNESHDVSPCGPLRVALDQPKLDITTFSFDLDPAIELAPRLDDDLKSFELTPKACLKQNQPYNLVVKRSIIFPPGDEKSENTESIYSGTFVTALAPSIAEYAPQGTDVSVTTQTLTLRFTHTMNRDALVQALIITPPLKGSWTWNDDVLMYTLAELLAYDTSYTITVPKGVTTESGGYIEEDSRITFVTIGRVKVVSLSPATNARSVLPTSAIKATFNQEVDHASVAQSWQISPEVTGDFSWSGKTLTFTPRQALSKDTSYAVSFKPGITSAGEGLVSTETFSSRFQTQESSVILTVALDYQDKPLSCEAAALKMALAYKGVTVSETEIMNLVGYDATLHQGNVWGDPDIAFVGDINGRQNATGYGVHWGPIARAAGAWRQAKAFSGGTAAQVASELAQGNPMVMWGVFPTGASYDPWVTPSGKTIPAWKGEHARTVIGFRGPVDNPTHFIINDPITGRLTWTTKQFMANWATFNNSGVFVY